MQLSRTEWEVIGLGCMEWDLAAAAEVSIWRVKQVGLYCNHMASKKAFFS